MIFTKADRDNLFAIKTLLVQHVHANAGLIFGLDAIAESQGKLYAALDGLNAGIAQEIGELRKEMWHQFEILSLHPGLMVRAKPPRKRATKKGKRQ